MTVAIYARYSTDRQQATSIEDQIRVCRERAGTEGLSVTATYEDRAISGAIVDRAGYQSLLGDARDGQVRVILVEEVSRLWRSQSEQWRCVEELQFAGIRVIGVRDGIDTSRDGFELLLAVQGAMNARARQETAWRTHRGLSGRVARGLCAGGVPYGYRTEAVEGGKLLVMDEQRADIVRRIFDLRASGWSPRRIAALLNEEGLPSPRGSTWAASAIYGHPTKGTGILNNELYRGRMIWNRTKWVRPPGGGPRRRIDRPREEWQIQELPELQIIPDDLWRTVHARQASTRRGQRPPRSLLSGLIRCGQCGAPMVARDRYRYACSHHLYRGPAVCDSSLAVPRKDTDQTLLGIIREQLLSPDAIRTLQAEARTVVREMNDTDPSLPLRERLDGLDQEIARLVDAVAASGGSQALLTRLQTAEAERDEVRRELDHLPDQERLPDIIPGLIDRYREMLDLLPEEMKDAPPEARQAVADMLGEVRILADGEAIYAEVKTGSLIRLVAGVGFEPTTFGL
ncbi:MAG TPA: recombinase family protein [Thiohalobacter sp.]|nr:recombinase family protein [Thiohalobacter sp.]